MSELIDYEVFERERSKAKLAEPKPLPEGLSRVDAFDETMLPESLRPWAADIAERMQVPLDFVAVPAMIAAGASLGRKIAIRPQARTDWAETPNLWGCIVGRPGALKSPAMKAALAPLERLEAEARKEAETARASYELEVEAHKLRKAHAADEARKRLKAGDTDLLTVLAVTEPPLPESRRYLASDTSYEALGVLMAENDGAILAFRDELVSLLKTLDREDAAAARGFYLSAWAGSASYSFDRITRGKQHIEGACLSLLGSTQPGRIREYLATAIRGGAADDGLIQRFGLLVWPDQAGEWKDTDRYPDSAARQAAFDTFSRLDRFDALTSGAETDEYGGVPFFRLSPAALERFAEWRADLEHRLRAGDLHPAFESHLAKYRKLVPSLALVAHVADGGHGAVGELAMIRALAWAHYLETHARRAYGAAVSSDVVPAKLILRKIKTGDLAPSFTARDVHRPRWTGLAEKADVQAGLDLLVDCDWLASESASTGGRPSVVYHLNPKAKP